MNCPIYKPPPYYVRDDDDPRPLPNDSKWKLNKRMQRLRFENETENEVVIVVESKKQDEGLK